MVPQRGAHGLVVLAFDHVEQVAAVAPDPPGVYPGGPQGGVEVVGDPGVDPVVVGFLTRFEPGVQGDAFHSVLRDMRYSAAATGSIGSPRRVPLTPRPGTARSPVRPPVAAR